MGKVCKFMHRNSEKIPLSCCQWLILRRMEVLRRDYFKFYLVYFCILFLFFTMGTFYFFNFKNYLEKIGILDIME